MKKFSNVQLVFVAAVALMIGLGLDHIAGGRPFNFVILAVGLGICVIFLFLPEMWTRDWKIMRAFSILSLIVFALTLFNGFVINCMSWMGVGIWSTVFFYSSYQWWVLRRAKRRAM